MKATKPLLALIAAVAFAGPAVAQSIPDSTGDGLERRNVPGLDIAYVRPGVDLSEYDRVRFGPVSVSFRKNFERDAAPGPNKRVSESDLQGIRQRLGALLLEEVTRELEAGGYDITTATGHDVMQIDLSVNDLTMAFVPQRQGPDEVMAFSTGEMLLEAELSDSVTGEMQARIYDLAEGRVTHQLHRIQRSENEREARDIAVTWAKTLREKIDAARKMGPLE
jgi:hypothetical protein